MAEDDELFQAGPLVEVDEVGVEAIEGVGVDEEVGGMEFGLAVLDFGQEEALARGGVVIAEAQAVTAEAEAVGHFEVDGAGVAGVGGPDDAVGGAAGDGMAPLDFDGVVGGDPLAAFEAVEADFEVDHRRPGEGVNASCEDCGGSDFEDLVVGAGGGKGIGGGGGGGRGSEEEGEEEEGEALGRGAVAGPGDSGAGGVGSEFLHNEPFSLCGSN